LKGIALATGRHFNHIVSRLKLAARARSEGMRNLYRLNLLSRLVFLIITPALFLYFNFAFIWHSIYWGVVTFTVLLWLGFIVITPLLGRVGCGWFCFIGTIQDLVTDYSIVHIKGKRPIPWVRILGPILFLVSVIPFLLINVKRGTIQRVRVIPFFFPTGLSGHYIIVWVLDCLGAVLLGLFLNKRWACKNLCIMGSLCAAGAARSRLLPVVDNRKCTRCGACERDCPANIPILEEAKVHHGLVTDSECLICGKCLSSCKVGAVTYRFVFSRSKFMARKNTMEADAAGKPRLVSKRQGLQRGLLRIAQRLRAAVSSR
jgi:ferredoxin-type protein NapH